MQSKPKVKAINFLLLAVLLFLFAPLTPAPSFAQSNSNNWSKPIIISGKSQRSWFADLTGDPQGRIYVIWCATTVPLDTGDLDQILYTYYDGTKWSEPNDLIPPNPDITRNAITMDFQGNLIMIRGGDVVNGPRRMYLMQAQASKAWSAQAWSEPKVLNLGISYAGDIEIDSSQRIHIVYDDRYRPAGVASADNLSDIYYRNSDDGGKTWSRAISLFPETKTGSARASLTVDGQDILHVTWDEGWDRLTGIVKSALHGVYISSKDGGTTWSQAKVIQYPNTNVIQTTVGSNNNGGVMLVWRTTIDTNLYYQWSPDGTRWDSPQMISSINARPYLVPFDRYEMATDSSGNIHLIVTGQHNTDPTPLVGVYHLVWDGKIWSAPEKIYEQENFYPEYPRIKIFNGNEMHAVWNTRQNDAINDDVNKNIWYSKAMTNSPHIKTPLLKNTPTPTPTNPVTPDTSLPVTPTVPGAVPVNGQENSPSSNFFTIYTETDYLKVLAVIMSPVLLGLLSLVLVIRYKRK
jgi:hypothetical protein